MNYYKLNNANKKHIIIVHPSGRYYGSGHYIQEWAYQLVLMGHEVIVFSEGKCPSIDANVMWFEIAFQGIRLSKNLRKIVYTFKPDIIIEVGVRTIPMRVAIELKIMNPNARFIVQAEDDENLVFKKYYPSKYNNLRLLEILDTEKITIKQLFRFISLLDIWLTFNILINPTLYRSVEPVLRIICYKIADLHTTIWFPMQERLYNKFRISTFIIPPFVNINNFYCDFKYSPSRTKVLEKYCIKSDSFILFVNGTIYDFSDEFIIFIKAVKQLSDESGIHITLVILNINESMKIKVLSMLNNSQNIELKIIGNQKEFFYNSLIKNSHLICAPGIEDNFNKYRMSSRLVKAMVFGKPIFTFYSGFGESLLGKEFAFLTKTNDYNEWSTLLLEAYNKFYNKPFDYNSRLFAEKYFNSKLIIHNFNKVIQAL